ncbi:heat shock factor binding protein 1-domain-containing protein [Abortiporus biennis]|nr:heat shock factor binding protein 1-domain-containing protein [Abortiporus biennis]
MPPQSSALPLNVTSTPSKPGSGQSANGASSTAPSSLKPPPNPSDISSPHELTAFVETLLEQLETKFDDMSSQILDRMMQMSTRVDALEASIQDIINGDNTNVPPSMPQSPSVATKRTV